MSEKPRIIQLVDIDKVIPHPKNAKKHPPEQVKKLAVAIKAFGWSQPIIVWKGGVIIAGHGRRLAAIELGLTKVPIIDRSDLSEKEADALRLADNRVSSTEYDQAMMQDVMRELALDFDLTLAGFDDKEIDFIQADLGEIDIDHFVDDVSGAVEQQKADNEQAVQNVDDVAAPVADAFGFKRVTIAQSRVIRDLMNMMEEKTGKTGVDALIDFVSSSVSQA